MVSTMRKEYEEYVCRWDEYMSTFYSGYMPWGKYAHFPLEEVPNDYWQWLLDQGFRCSWPEMAEYAQDSVNNKRDNIINEFFE